MKLVIELKECNGSVSLLLISEELMTNSSQVYMQENEVLLIKTVLSDIVPGYKRFLKTLSGYSFNQTALIVYFLFNERTFNREVIYRWLGDCGLENNYQLADQIYLLRIENLESINIATQTIYNELQHRMLTVNNTQNELVTLAFVLNEVNSGKEICFCYDDYTKTKACGSNLIDLSKINETLFEVEDKSCIIIGLSVSFTSFIISVSNERTLLMETLCNTVPIELRDKYCVYTVLNMFPQISGILTLHGYKDMECYGVNKLGKLIKADNFLIDSEQKDEKIGIIPLFIKIIK